MNLFAVVSWITVIVTITAELSCTLLKDQKNESAFHSELSGLRVFH